MAQFTTRPHFTFTWTINNFREELSLAVVSLTSPVFTVDFIEKTKWSLGLSVESSTTGHVICVLQREDDENRLSNVFIDFMLSIIDSNEGFRSIKDEECYFGINSGNAIDYFNRVSKKLLQVRTLVSNFDKYVPDNTLTIRCKMWKSGCNALRIDFCFARTIINIEKRSFIWTIENICFILLGEIRTIHVPLFNEGSPSLQLNLSLRQRHGEEIFCIEMYEIKNLRHVDCEISNLNSEGKSESYWKNTIKNVTYMDKKCLLFQSFIRKRGLLLDQNHLLTNGALILKFKFQLSFGVVWNKIENYNQQLFKVEEATSESERPSTSISHSQSSCSSKKILEHLLHEGTNSDITLRAGNKSFPVHKNILSARSLIFRSKFLIEEGQVLSRVMDLSSEMDEFTLRSLLLYIYTDAVEDLDFGNAIELYQSAEKYLLTDLKDICGNFLISNLSVTNIFQVLSFANIYRDDKMKAAAQDFISELGNDFTSSEQWQDFKKRNLDLAMETMEYIFSNKRIKTVHLS